jgi:hypothetical protein
MFKILRTLRTSYGRNWDPRVCSKHVGGGYSGQSNGSWRDFATAARVSLPAGRAAAPGAGARRTSRPTSLDPGRAPPVPLSSPRHSPPEAPYREHAEDTSSPLLAHAHPWSECPAPPTSPSTSGTARASSRRPEETPWVNDRSSQGRSRKKALGVRPPACASPPQPLKSARAPQLPPGADQRLGTARTPPATPRPPHFVMGHSDSDSGVAGAGDCGWRARGSTAHALRGARACALAKHELGSPGCGLFSWRPGRCAACIAV